MAELLYKMRRVHGAAFLGGKMGIWGPEFVAFDPNIKIFLS